MTSKLDIINAALVLIGEKPTNTLGEDASATVISCEALYNIFYRVFISGHKWRFAMTTSQLSKSADAPVISKWKYAYLLPEDYSSISHLEPRHDYEIYGIYLYTNLDNTDPNNLPTLFYTKVVPENILPDYYIGYLVEAMATLFATFITQNENQGQIWAASSQQRKRDAICIDDQNQPPRKLERGSVFGAQYGDVLRGWWNGL